MQETVSLLDLHRIESIDRKIVNYLSALAGKSLAKFCSPSIDRIRFAAAWGMPDSFIEERLAHLAAIGRVRRAVAEVNGVAMAGFIVLPNREFKQREPKDYNRFVLTASDRAFLHGCGVRVDN